VDYVKYLLFVHKKLLEFPEITQKFQNVFQLENQINICIPKNNNNLIRTFLPKVKSISLPIHPFKHKIPSKLFKVIQKPKVFNFANTLQSLFRFYLVSAYIVSSSKFPKAALNRLCENFSILVYFILLDMKKFIFFL